MTGVVAVSAIPIAVAFVVGVGGFVALLPLLLADPVPTKPRTTARELHVVTAVVPDATVSDAIVPHAIVPDALPATPAPIRVSRLRLAVVVSALVVWSVWTVHLPHDRIPYR